jgi:UDP-perosamine 4-acetyltransferase
VLAMPSDGVRLVNGVGSVGVAGLRRRLYENFKRAGFLFESVIHPAAVVADQDGLAEGVQVMAGAVIQPGSRIGGNAIINTHATIDHDCRVGSHVHVAPGAVLAGEVTIGDGSFVGAGAIIIQTRKVGTSALIGAGAVVIDDVRDNEIVAGVPARAIKK